MPASTLARPYDPRRPIWLVPWITFLGITALTTVLHQLTDPAARLIQFDPKLPDNLEDAGRFLIASRRWTAALLATAVATLGVLVLGLATVVEFGFARGPEEARHRSAGKLLLVLVGATFVAAWLVDVRVNGVDALPPYWAALSVRDARLPHLIAQPISYVIAPLNALISAAIASLFAATTVVIARARSAPAGVEAAAWRDRLRGRLLVLLAAGATAESVAVLHLAAEHRLPSSLLRAADEAQRAAQAAVMDQLALGEALFWGAAYSVGLVALYLVPASVLANADSARAASPADGEEVLPSPQKWGDVLRPFVPVATVLGPFVTGVLSSLLGGGKGH